MKLSIIIPAYNEEKRIAPILKQYLDFYKKRFSKFEIIVAIEGTDNTLNVVKQFRKKTKKIRYLYSKERLGKGGGIIQGLRHATGDLIGFTDADGSINAESFLKLINAVDDVDAVIASRSKKGAVIIKQRPLLQVMGSRGLNVLVRLLFFLPFKDTQCGAKVFKKRAIKAIVNKLKVTGWTFDIDILFKLTKEKFAVKEIPITWEHITGAKFSFAKSFWKLVPQMFLSLIKLRIGDL